jgi:hypothetical protein
LLKNLQPRKRLANRLLPRTDILGTFVQRKQDSNILRISWENARLAIPPQQNPQHQTALSSDIERYCQNNTQPQVTSVSLLSTPCNLVYNRPVGPAGFEHPANFLGKCEVGDSGAAKSAALNRSFDEKAKPDRPDTASGNPGESQPSEPGNRLAEALRIIASLSETERELLIRLLESFGKNKP